MRRTRRTAGIVATIMTMGAVAAGPLVGATTLTLSAPGAADARSSMAAASLNAPVDYSTDEYFDM